MLFRSLRDGWTLAENHLYTVSAEGGSAVAAPDADVSRRRRIFSSTGSRWCTSPLFRDFRSEKRYGGGQANRLWIFDLAGKTAKPISEGPRAERDPMWLEKTIYYNTDKTGTFNLWTYDIASGQRRQVTQGTTWDLRWPSLGDGGRIVYELGGELQVLDTKIGAVHADLHHGADRRCRVPPVAYLGGRCDRMVQREPKGERALFVGRGDVFTAPIEKGPTRNLTNSSGAHDRDARWSPDGKEIAYISDQTGEEEVWVIPQDGTGKATQLTSGGKARRSNPVWSPDGKRIAFGDKDGKLYVLGRADKKVIEVADDPRGTIGDYVWSPRGNYLAFSMRALDNELSVYIWSAGDGKVRRVTGQPFAEYNPAWDPKGDYLYFLSDREYQPLLSNVEFNFAENRTTGIFALALRKDVKDPFPPQSDEVKPDSVAPDSASKAPAKEKERSPKRRRIVRPPRPTASRSTSTASRRESPGFRSRPTISAASPPRRITCCTWCSAASTTDETTTGRPRSRSILWRSARTPRSPPTSTAMSFPRTARRSCYPAPRPTNCSMRRRPVAAPRRRSRRPASR